MSQVSVLEAPRTTVRYVEAHPQNRSGSVLTPLGERLAREEIISYRDFFMASLPTSALPMTDFCVELMRKLHEASSCIEGTTQSGNKYKPHFLFNLRGSAVRRAVWEPVYERDNHPVTDYWSISPWWQKYFNKNYFSMEPTTNLDKAAQMLMSGPGDIDPRFEYVMDSDKQLFGKFIDETVPAVIAETLKIMHPDMFLAIEKHAGGGDLFDALTHRFGFLSKVMHINRPGNGWPILSFDCGTANQGREMWYVAHNHGEPKLLATDTGLRLVPNSDHQRKILTGLFNNGFNSYMYSAASGAQKLDIVTIGTRQMYFGAFYDHSKLPVFDKTMVNIIKKLKFVFNDDNASPRNTEIAVNSIVGFMVDPLYVAKCFQLSDYFRQMPRLNYLADDVNMQNKLIAEIKRRMDVMRDNYFVDQVWDPFLIIDALNQINPPEAHIDRTFAELFHLFSPNASNLIHLPN